MSGQLISVRRSASGHLYADKVDHCNRDHDHDQLYHDHLYDDDYGHLHRNYDDESSITV